MTWGSNGNFTPKKYLASKLSSQKNIRLKHLNTDSFNQTLRPKKYVTDLLTQKHRGCKFSTQKICWTPLHVYCEYPTQFLFKPKHHCQQGFKMF